MLCCSYEPCLAPAMARQNANDQMRRVSRDRFRTYKEADLSARESGCDIVVGVDFCLFFAMCSQFPSSTPSLLPPSSRSLPSLPVRDSERALRRVEQVTPDLSTSVSVRCVESIET
jgi:hypothetical protein